MKNNFVLTFSIFLILISQSCTNSSDTVVPTDTPTGGTTNTPTGGTTITSIGGTISVDNISQTTVHVFGKLINNNGATITAAGICYATKSNPTVSDLTQSYTEIISIDFSGSLVKLLPSTTYYVRAYATNKFGTVYGEEVSFTTLALLPAAPVITTTSANLVTSTTANIGGNITNSGTSNVTSRGVCYSTTITTPTINDSKTSDGIGIGTYISTLINLVPNKTYYVRAYATNSIGTSYGLTQTFTTLPKLEIGQSYQGGVIAYIFTLFDSGYVAGEIHGLIATTSNQSTATQWGCLGTSINVTSLNFGTGTTNTNVIVTACTTSGIAAKICNDLIFGSYSDWYLPSYSELYNLYSNKAIIGGFNDNSYWSSSEFSSDSAYSIDFTTGTTNAANQKNNLLYVRAVRKF